MRVICCDECFNELACHRPSESKLWLDLCEMYGTLGNLTVKEWLIPDQIDILRDLECDGYIDTLDGKDFISVRVNGLETVICESEILQTFCIERGCHDEDWG